MGCGWAGINGKEGGREGGREGKREEGREGRTSHGIQLVETVKMTPICPYQKQFIFLTPPSLPPSLPPSSSATTQKRKPSSLLSRNTTWR